MNRQWLKWKIFAGRPKIIINKIVYLCLFKKDLQKKKNYTNSHL